MLDASWQAAGLTPAAFSVQVMNPEALQTSTGMVYIGRVKNQFSLANQNLSSTVGALSQNLVSYCNPRICSAGKLALRGVQVDAVPSDMQALANFSPLATTTDGDFTAAATSDVDFAGFNPIFVFNPQGVELNALVTVEWRVRFDVSNPAHSACTYRPPSSERTWAQTMQQAVQLGNGVIDIVQAVSRLGA